MTLFRVAWWLEAAGIEEKVENAVGRGAWSEGRERRSFVNMRMRGGSMEVVNVGPCVELYC